ATGPGAFDCSGLTMMAYRAAGIAIPRTSQQQWAAEPHVRAGQEQPGDLVFFVGSDGTMTAPGHVGIAVTASNWTRRSKASPSRNSPTEAAPISSDSPAHSKFWMMKNVR